MPRGRPKKLKIFNFNKKDFISEDKVTCQFTKAEQSPSLGGQIIFSDLPGNEKFNNTSFKPISTKKSQIHRRLKKHFNRSHYFHKRYS